MAVKMERAKESNWKMAVMQWKMLVLLVIVV